MGMYAAAAGGSFSCLCVSFMGTLRLVIIGPSLLSF
jgi:hypothetical protein